MLNITPCAVPETRGDVGVIRPKCSRGRPTRFGCRNLCAWYIRSSQTQLHSKVRSSHRQTPPACLFIRRGAVQSEDTTTAFRRPGGTSQCRSDDSHTTPSHMNIIHRWALSRCHIPVLQNLRSRAATHKEPRETKLFDMAGRHRMMPGPRRLLYPRRVNAMRLCLGKFSRQRHDWRPCEQVERVPDRWRAAPYLYSGQG